MILRLILLSGSAFALGVIMTILVLSHYQVFTLAEITARVIHNCQQTATIPENCSVVAVEVSRDTGARL